MTKRKDCNDNWFRDEIADPMLLAAVRGVKPGSILSRWAIYTLADGSIDTGTTDTEDGAYHAEIWWVNCANGYAWLVSSGGQIVAQVSDEEMYPRVAVDAIGIAEGVIRDLRVKARVRGGG